jgi:ribosomal protein L37E
VTPCTVCGFPRWRRAGHAEWCERVRGWLRRSREAAEAFYQERFGERA